MARQTYSTQSARINKYKGRILAHAVPVEVLGRIGRQVRMPKNSSKTYSARRWIPYRHRETGTTIDAQNVFFQDSTADSEDRANLLAVAHQVTEGTTPTADSMTAADVETVIQQYGCLYSYTDVVADLYEDNVPEEMVKQVGERTSLVNEMIIYAALKGCSNQFYGGTGTTIATVNGGLTKALLRKVSTAIQARHGKMVSMALTASPNYGTSPVSKGWFVYCHTDCESAIRDIPGFIPCEKYAEKKMESMPYEIGAWERFRFITSPELVSHQRSGAAVGTTGLKASNSKIDVYRIVVAGEDAFSQLAVRGVNAMDPSFIPPGQKDKTDPLGQIGYIGTKWYKACKVENDSWMAMINVGIPA